MKSTIEVGKRLVELCAAGKSLQAVDELYGPNIVSIEVADMPGMPARMEGIDAIRKKNQWFYDNHTIHSSIATGPWPHGDRFVVNFDMDATPKAGPMAGKRTKMQEAALYTVKDGKIVKEEFFYDMGK